MADLFLRGSSRHYISWQMTFFSFMFICIVGCGRKKPPEQFPSPAGYNLNKPITYKLPTDLDEISGIVYYPKDKSLFAIHDEKGFLYKIYLTQIPRISKWKFAHEKIGNTKISKWKSAHGVDFEDLVLLDSTFYSLKSNGNIVGFKFLTPDSLQHSSYKWKASGRNEFEIIFADSSRKQLIIICKDCEQDPRNITSAYAFDYKQKKFLDTPVFTLDKNTIETKTGNKIGKFKPSGAAIHPATGQLFIISSVNKLLVIANTNGKVEEAYPLSPKIFKQPEGIAFTPAGDLLISNESADIGPANILLFKYNQSKQQ